MRNFYVGTLTNKPTVDIHGVVYKEILQKMIIKFYDEYTAYLAIVLDLVTKGNQRDIGNSRF